MHNIPEIGLTIDDLVDGNSSQIDEYLALYNELLPQYYRYAPVMRQRAESRADKSSLEKWHQWLLKINNQPVGMIGVIYNRNRNTGILMDFAIKAEARKISYKQHDRFAGLILQLAMEQLITDAQEFHPEHPLCMIAEVEHAPLVKKYGQYGYREFPIDYYEPPYTPELLKNANNPENLDKIGYQKLHLGAFEIPGQPFDPNDAKIIKTAVLTLLEDHYRLPAGHWLIQKMIEQVIPFEEFHL